MSLNKTGFNRRIVVLVLSLLILCSLSGYVYSLNCPQSESSVSCKSPGSGAGVYCETEDEACCPPNSCVFNGECYQRYDTNNPGASSGCFVDVSPNAVSGADPSNDYEVCTSAGWSDPDASSPLCDSVNKHPNPTRWMQVTSAKATVCGLDKKLKLEDQGDGCNDAPNTLSKSNFCCGDDVEEVLKEGSEFENVCFTKKEDCYFEGRYYLEGDFYLDNYCEEGKITSRTKLISLLLLEIAESTTISKDDYTLFSDSYEKTLNYYDYKVNNKQLSEYLSPNNVNNFIVLRLPEQVILGVSLNQHIDEGTLPFIDLLKNAGASFNCNGAKANTDGKFHQCGVARVWYNSKTKSVIYSDKDILPDSDKLDVNSLEMTFIFLKHPLQTIASFFKKETKSDNYNFINDAERFSKLYLDKKGARHIQGIEEKAGEKEFLSVAYNCYGEDICKTIKPALNEEEQCLRDEGIASSYVLLNTPQNIGLWQELTSGLRTNINPPDTSNLVIRPHITALPAQAIANTEIKMESEVEGCFPDYTYSWNFGDGSAKTATPDTSHTYSGGGVHTVTLTVTPTTAPAKSQSVTAQIKVISPQSCKVTAGQQCDSNSDFPNCILSLSSQTDAHVSRDCNAVAGLGFSYRLCCQGIYQLDDVSSQAGILSLSQNIDGHADFFTSGGFTNSVFIQSTIEGTKVRCRYSTEPCTNIESCIISLSDETNAHLSQCDGTNFRGKVCCGIVKE